MTLADSPDPGPGFVNDVGDVTYSLTVANLTSPALTPDVAHNTRTSFRVSRGTILSVTASEDDINCVVDVGAEAGFDDIVNCTFGQPFAGSADIDIVVSPPGGLTISASASVTSDRFDPDPSNNSDSEDTVVEAGLAGGKTNAAKGFGAVGLVELFLVLAASVVMAYSRRRRAKANVTDRIPMGRSPGELSRTSRPT